MRQVQAFDPLLRSRSRQAHVALVFSKTLGQRRQAALGWRSYLLRVHGPFLTFLTSLTLSRIFSPLPLSPIPSSFLFARIYRLCLSALFYLVRAYRRPAGACG